MYRACELSLNTNSNREETLVIYKLFLKSEETITAYHLGSGSQASDASGPDVKSQGAD
jgi:hypothetical protein